MQRLGKNINGYFGEGINIDAVLKDSVNAALKHGWIVQGISANAKLKLIALARPATAPLAQSGKSPGARNHPCIYISAGIHGDEPAGPLAIRQLLEEEVWPPDVNLWVLPCLNPTGFALNRRENAGGVDLNRQYLQPKAEETLAHIDWLERQPRFDLCLCLHEDWESHGFYVYELNPDGQPSLAERIVTRVAEVCPIDNSEIIEGRHARKGVIRPDVDPWSRPQWPESFFLLTYKTRQSYTLEAPSDFPLSVRVAALVQGVRAGLEARRGT